MIIRNEVDSERHDSSVTCFDSLALSRRPQQATGSNGGKHSSAAPNIISGPERPVANKVYAGSGYPDER